MLRKYAAQFPFDVTLKESITHGTFAALRQAFIQCLQNYLDPSDPSRQSPSVSTLWKVSRFPLFIYEICIYKVCIANMPRDLNYIFMFLWGLYITESMHRPGPHSPRLCILGLSQASSFRVWSMDVQIFLQLSCSHLCPPLIVKCPGNTFEARIT